LENDFYCFGYVGDQNRDFLGDLGMKPKPKTCFFRPLNRFKKVWIISICI